MAPRLNGSSVGMADSPLDLPGVPYGSRPRSARGTCRARPGAGPGAACHAAVSPLTDREEVARLISKYNLLAVPVVDEGVRRLGFDPASASAPFVATLVDVTGLVIYFTVAALVLRGTLL